MKKIVVLSMMLLLMGFVVAANASPFCYQVGDVDGYGFGGSDQGTVVWPAYPPPAYDGRSAAEAAATDGAQFTDSYSTLYRVIALLALAPLAASSSPCRRI